MVQNHITSADGARLAYRTIGSGSPLIIIPGVMSVAAMYDQLAVALADQFTVHVLERRGRGDSAAQPPDYRIETEIDDVDALRAATGATQVFGHSFGGLIALEYARRRPGALSRLAVYDPGISVAHSIPSAWVPRYRELLAANRPAKAFAYFSIAAGPARARRMPLWLMMLMTPLFLSSLRKRHFSELLPTVATEHLEIERLNDTWRGYAAIQAPVLLMVSGKSDLPWIQSMVGALSSALPAHTCRTFPELDHFGPDHSGPLAVASAIREAW